MGRLQGKVALVTGTASNPGLGHATARRLAAEGAKLVTTDMDEAGAALCAAAIIAAGGEALSLRQDVVSAEDWARVIGETESRFGRLDILVNNAGIHLTKSIDDTTPQEFQRQLDVNLVGTFLGVKTALPLMRASGAGSIVNLSSVAGTLGIQGLSAYAAAKGGVRTMTKTIAVENACHGIRCNSIHPGMIWTNMMMQAASSAEAVKDALMAAIPLGRMGEPDDIANAVLFLASDESRYITGIELYVDGGMWAQ
ncbi:MAG: SDR family NAD(P)-dependent oxidoreductase [Niveispirillum sp.]|uniref:SDR family NAD(P)-dependent oxidoreductase n=1 Tax=Niveispirillum sp. TaxID=1917217 RepID=UPI003BA5CDCB